MKIDVFKEALPALACQTDEFIHEIVCGVAAFNELRKAAEGLQYCYNPVSMTTEYRYMGIPLTIVSDRDLVEDRDVRIISVRQEMAPNDERYVEYEFERKFIIDDTVDTYFQPEWLKAPLQVKLTAEDREISDDDLMAVLNGGGYQAVKE